MRTLQTGLHLAENDVVTVRAMHGGDKGSESYWIEIGIWNAGEISWRSIPDVRFTLFCKDKEHQGRVLVQLADFNFVNEVDSVK